MKIKRISKMVLTGLIAVVLVIALSACTRSKSTATVAVGTQAGDAGFSVPTPEGTQNMGIFENLTTPTAAPDMGTQVVGEQATPQPAATETPAVQPTAGVVEIQNNPQPTTAPVAASTQVLPTAGPNPATYALQKGEHPFCIARRFNVDQYELLSLNGLGSTSVVGAGTVLKIPTTGHPFVSDRVLKAHPAKYTVTAGDTIYGIACKFGDVRPEVIAAANNLSAPYTLTSGQILNIP